MQVIKCPKGKGQGQLCQRTQWSGLSLEGQALSRQCEARLGRGSKDTGSGHRVFYLSPCTSHEAEQDPNPQLRGSGSDAGRLLGSRAEGLECTSRESAQPWPSTAIVTATCSPRRSSVPTSPGARSNPAQGHRPFLSRIGVLIPRHGWHLQSVTFIIHTWHCPQAAEAGAGKLRAPRGDRFLWSPVPHTGGSWEVSGVSWSCCKQ